MERVISDVELDLELDLQTKYIYVKKWLEKVYHSGSCIPKVDSNVVDELYSLAMEHEENERQTARFIKEMEDRVRHYEKETNQLISIQDMVGITINDLPPETQEQISILSKTSNMLECSDTCSISILLAMSQNQSTLSKLSNEVQLLSKELNRVEEAILQAEVERERLSKLAEEVNGHKKTLDKQIPNTVTQTNFLKQKSIQYQSQITSLEEKLNESRFSPSIRHSELTAIHRDIQSLEDTLQPLRKKLEHFQSLPPNLELAQLKLHELQVELTKLDQEISSDIDLMDAEK